MSKSFDVAKINNNFFALFGAKKPADIASLVGVGVSAVYSWQSHAKQVPWDKLALAKELTGKSWDYMLGADVSERRDVPPTVSPSITNPNVVRVLDPEPINLIFRLQQVVAEIGQHVAVGKTLADFPEKNQLKAIIRRILERIEDDAPQSEIPDQDSPADQDSNVIRPESHSHGNTA